MVTYVLQLQHQKYYVGETDNLDRCLRLHKQRRGDKYTIIHPPIGVVETSETLSVNEMLDIYEERYGKENVGGVREVHWTFEGDPEEGMYCVLERNEHGDWDDDEQKSRMDTGLEPVRGMPHRISCSAP